MRRLVLTLGLSFAAMIVLDAGVSAALYAHGLEPREPGLALTARIVWALVEGLAP